MVYNILRIIRSNPLQEMKESSVSCCQFDDKTSCIIVSLSNRQDTQIINIDPLLGTLLFSGISGSDVFPTKKDALDFVTQNRKINRIIEAHSILGYVFSDKCCCLILIEKAKQLFSLFDKHMVYSIEKTLFIEIPVELKFNDLSPPSQIQKLKNYPFEYSHFFCPTLDLSKDLTGRGHVVRYCWNQQLMKPFDQFKNLVPNFCTPVFQGIASYTPFVQFGVDVLFLGSHSYPQTPTLPQQGKHYATEKGVTCNEYTLDIYFIRTKNNGFELLNHLVEIGDFPFCWNKEGTTIHVGENNSTMAKAFIERQKKLFGFEYIAFLNFMNKDQYEEILITTLDKVLGEVSSSSNSYEQDQIDWPQSNKDAKLLSDYVLNYWPRSYSKIPKFGFNKSFISNDAIITVLRKQNGVFRILFNDTFDREILALFFFILTVLGTMCQEYNLGFPTRLVCLDDINTFGPGFTFFAGKFLLEFYQFICQFGNFPGGELHNHILTFLNPANNVDLNPYKIEYPILQNSTIALMEIIVPSITSVSQSISAFVMSEKIGNAILRPMQNGYIGLNAKEKPFVICLAEPSHLTEIIFKNTNAISVTISAGLRLNETFLVAKKVILPFVQSPGTKTYNPYIRINLRPSKTYDYDIRPFDFEKVKFLFFKFKTFRQEPLRIGGVFVYGSLTPPFVPEVNLSLSAQSSGTFPISDPNLLTTAQSLNHGQNIPKNTKPKNSPKTQKSPKDKSTSTKSPLEELKVENLIEKEKKRLQQHESYFSYQKEAIARNIPLDRIDFEQIYIPGFSSNEPKKTTCSRCKTKLMCNECSNCRKMFCKNCLPKMLRYENRSVYLCDACKESRKEGMKRISHLKCRQYSNIVDMYPFIGKHSKEVLLDKSCYLKFGTSMDSELSPASIFSDINRPPLSMFAIEPPSIIKFNQKECNLMPECILTSHVKWSIDTNVLQLTVIFACEAKISGLHLACSSPLRILVKDANPHELSFTPPGSIQNVNFSGRMAQVLITGDVINIHHLRFIGFPVILPPEELYSSNSGSSTNIATNQIVFQKIDTSSIQFSDEMKCHEIVLQSIKEIWAFKYNHPPKEFIAELTNEGETKYIRHKVATLEPNFDDTISSGYIVLPKSIHALKIRIFYPRISSDLLLQYRTEMPEIVSKPKAKIRKLSKFV